MKLGFMVDDLGASQLSYYLTENTNRHVQKDILCDITVYYETLHQNSILPNFPVLQIAEAWGQPGVMVATSLFTARKLLNMPGPIKRFFYCWDLDWMRGRGTRPYEVFESTYRHPRLELIARNEFHKSAVENAFNRPVRHIIDNFEIPAFLKL